MDPYVSSSSDKPKKKKKKSKDPYGPPPVTEDPYGPPPTGTAGTESGGRSFASTTANFGKQKTSRGKKSKKAKQKPKPASSYSYEAVDTGPNPVLEASGWKELQDEHKAGGVLSGTIDGSGGVFEYAITGDESQIVTVAVPPGESCQGEPGSMMYLTSPVSMKVSCGADWFGRCCGGESCCVVNFNNHTGEVGYAALTTNQPLAKVVPVSLSSSEVGGTLIVQQGAYMASYGHVELSYDCDCNLVRCCCGGMGLVRQKITGSGTAFLGATGTIVEKVLAEGEVMLMDTNCILAYAESCTFDLKKTGGIVNWIGGGEGFFNSSLKGPGLVVAQSMNMCLLLESLAAEKMYRR